MIQLIYFHNFNLQSFNQFKLLVNLIRHTGYIYKFTELRRRIHAHYSVLGESVIYISESVFAFIFMSLMLLL